jgi:hypothetical protein
MRRPDSIFIYFNLMKKSLLLFGVLLPCAQHLSAQVGPQWWNDYGLQLKASSWNVPAIVPNIDPQPATTSVSQRILMFPPNPNNLPVITPPANRGQLLNFTRAAVASLVVNSGNPSDNWASNGIVNFGSGAGSPPFNTWTTTNAFDKWRAWYAGPPVIGVAGEPPYCLNPVFVSTHSALEPVTQGNLITLSSAWREQIGYTLTPAISISQPNAMAAAGQLKNLYNFPVDNFADPIHPGVAGWPSTRAIPTNLTEFSPLDETGIESSENPLSHNVNADVLSLEREYKFSFDLSHPSLLSLKSAAEADRLTDAADACESFKIAQKVWDGLSAMGNSKGSTEAEGFRFLRNIPSSDPTRWDRVWAQPFVVDQGGETAPFLIERNGIPIQAETVVITEWCMRNLGTEWSGGNAGDLNPGILEGKFGDWVEIQNQNSVGAELNLFALSDDITNPGKLVLAGTLDPGKRAVVVFPQTSTDKAKIYIFNTAAATEIELASNFGINDGEPLSISTKVGGVFESHQCYNRNVNPGKDVSNIIENGRTTGIVQVGGRFKVVHYAAAKASPNGVNSSDPADFSVATVAEEPELRIYLDLYFDTYDYVGVRHDATYRLRQRFTTPQRALAYLRDENSTSDATKRARLEIQTKYNKRQPTQVQFGVSVGIPNSTDREFPNNDYLGKALNGEVLYGPTEWYIGTNSGYTEVIQRREELRDDKAATADGTGANFDLANSFATRGHNFPALIRTAQKGRNLMAQIMPGPLSALGAVEKDGVPTGANAVAYIETLRQPPTKSARGFLQHLSGARGQGFDMQGNVRPQIYLHPVAAIISYRGRMHVFSQSPAAETVETPANKKEAMIVTVDVSQVYDPIELIGAARVGPRIPNDPTTAPFHNMAPRGTFVELEAQIEDDANHAFNIANNPSATSAEKLKSRQLRLAYQHDLKQLVGMINSLPGEFSHLDVETSTKLQRALKILYPNQVGTFASQ